MPSHIPFNSFLQFVRCYARATELILEYRQETIKELYDRIIFSDDRLQKFKFCAKVLHIALIGFGGTRGDPRTFTEVILYASLARFRQLGYRACPDLETVNKCLPKNVRSLPKFLVKNEKNGEKVLDQVLLNL